MFSQADKIAAHLKVHGSITQLEAINRYKCFRLAPRIHELRRMGISIMTVPVKNMGGGTHARYELCQS